uniref:Perlucin-like protein isoform X1 n=1 Tax=Crassostrea virginica TaxID=6565 RepID=A0A8B8ATK1_CRAVI|nr:perlucin-like protein isoform X1 [Crassostrea virginica]
MFILYIAAILVAGFTTIQTSCPVDWAEFSGECYYFGNVHRSWLDAENQCRRMHGFLLTDDNSAKHKFVSNILSVLHSLRQNTFWIGASDYTIEGHFRWLETGLPIGNFSAWGPGKPSQNDTKNCVRMFYNGDEYNWEDVDCNDRTTNYICEKTAENILLTTAESLIIGK